MPPQLVVAVLGNIDNLQKELGNAEGVVGGFGKAMGGIPIAPMLGAAAGVTAVASATLALGKVGADALAEEKKFAQGMEQLGAATGDWVAQTDEAIAASQALAFTDTETRNSLLALTTATGDAGSATDLLTSAQDIARLSGVSLEQASDAVAKAYAGQDGALRKLVPGLAKGATGMDTIAAATKAATGQADIFAESGEGMALRTTDAMGELVEEVGMALAPAFSEALTALMPLIEALGTLIKALMPVLVPALKAVGSALGFVANVITTVVRGITWLIDKIKELLKPLQDAINGLNSIDLNPFSSAVVGAQQAAMVGSRSGSSGGNRGNVTINIYGDPAVIEARVVRALKGYQMRNGTASLVTAGRW